MRTGILALVLCAAAPVFADVRVWQDTLSLPTSEEGAPDPNPPFDVFATDRYNYPYTLRENLTGKLTNVAWRAVYLENEYLKCSVLPDIGERFGIDCFIEIVPPHTLPRTSSGKLSRSKAREEFLSRHGPAILQRKWVGGSASAEARQEESNPCAASSR